MSATDQIRAIHREATSSPWDEPWSVEADADEHGYTHEYTVTTEVGWIATFAYAQHLELFVQAKRHMEALCDLSDACRAWMTGNCTLGQAEHRMADALARLYAENADG